MARHRAERRSCISELANIVFNAKGVEAMTPLVAQLEPARRFRTVYIRAGFDYVLPYVHTDAPAGEWNRFDR